MINSIKFYLNVDDFLSNYEELRALGLTNKEIANHLKLYPSAFSTLINKVLIPLSKLELREKNESNITQAFDSVNNLSKTKVMSSISEYCYSLNEMLKQVLYSRSNDPLSNGSLLDNLIKGSDLFQLKRLEGIYDCYYISSYNFLVKREPLAVYYSDDDSSFLVRKGNELSQSSYSGICYLNNPLLVSMHLLENSSTSTDNFIAHFQMPHSAVVNFDLLKGVSISMANSYLPIARKILIRRISNSYNHEDYELLPTVFYEKQDSKSKEAIISYLYNHTSVLEYIPVPQPTYSSIDLTIEHKISTLLAS